MIFYPKVIFFRVLSHLWKVIRLWDCWFDRWLMCSCAFGEQKNVWICITIGKGTHSSMWSQLFQITHTHAYIHTYRVYIPMKTDNAWITRKSNTPPAPQMAHPFPQNKYIDNVCMHCTHSHTSTKWSFIVIIMYTWFSFFTHHRSILFTSQRTVNIRGAKIYQRFIAFMLADHFDLNARQATVVCESEVTNVLQNVRQCNQKSY